MIEMKSVRAPISEWIKKNKKSVKQKGTHLNLSNQRRTKTKERKTSEESLCEQQGTAKRKNLHII